MINKKLEDAINNQIQAEFYSAYYYLAMAAHCEAKGLKGFAHWLKVQHDEERGHAMKLLSYLQERGGTVVLKAIEAPPVEFGSPLEVFEKVLAHEQHVTAAVTKLYEVALSEKDFAAQIFLQWFITEQVEEEASATEVLERLKMVGDRAGGLFFIDKELGKRV